MRAKGIKPTQRAAGALVGIGQPSARKWVYGGMPEMATAVKLATKLGVGVEWLLTGRGPVDPMVLDEGLKEIIWLWERTNEQRREDFLKTARTFRMLSNNGDPKRLEEYEASRSQQHSVHDR